MLMGKLMNVYIVMENGTKKILVVHLNGKSVLYAKRKTLEQ